MNLLSVDTVFFTVLGYAMSYIEFVGTLLYLWSVWLIARRRMLTWPVGIVSVLLFMWLFYQIRLYSDALEQIYYLGASVFGWWSWSGTRKRGDSTIPVSFGPRRHIVIWAAVTVVLSAILGAAMCRMHVWLPSLFPEPASFPYLDALTTVMSFVAMWLMVRRRVESWVYWIVVDVIGIGLYFVKDVKFIALLYVLLLVLATRGLIAWTRSGVRLRRAVRDPR
jgi:nicotinamide mononucleotide transporter